MKVKELKFYKSIETYQELYRILSSKIKTFSRGSPENTPLEYRNYDLNDFWSQHISILMNLDLLIIRETVCYKDYLVLNVDQSIVFYEDDKSRITNSSFLLETFLYRLNLAWISILPMFSELYSNSRYDFGALEYKFIDFFLDVILGISEILGILYSWHKDKIHTLFTPRNYFKKTYRGYFKVTYINPVFLVDERFYKYKNPCYRDFWVNKIIKNLCVDEGIVEVLYQGLKKSPKYKNMINTLGPREAISCVLRAILSDLDIKVLEFLGMNVLVDLEFFRNISQLNPHKTEQ